MSTLKCPHTYLESWEIKTDRHWESSLSYFIHHVIQQQPPEPPDRHSSDQDGSISNPSTSISKLGTIAACLVTVMFLGAWIARGVVEKKSPSFFEVAFASLTAVTALADPKAAPLLLTKIISRNPE